MRSPFLGLIPVAIFGVIPAGAELGRAHLGLPGTRPGAAMAAPDPADEHLLVPPWIREVMQHRGLVANTAASTGTLSKEAGAKLAVPSVVATATC